MAIGGCTVAELQSRMSRSEFEDWLEFYEDSPFDDLHRDHRPAAWMAGNFSGVEIEKSLKFLLNQPIKEQQEGEYTDIDQSVFSIFARPPKE